AGGPSGIFPFSATLNGRLLAGGAANAFIVWGDNDPGTMNTGDWDHVVAIGTVFESEIFSLTLPGLTNLTPYFYRCYVTNALGLDWSASTNFTTPDSNNRMISAGGNDSWNTPGNWTLGHSPVGPEIAVIASNIPAEVNTAPPVYTGGLVLEQGASLRINNASTGNAIPPAPITMHDQTAFIFADGGTIGFDGPITLLGAARVAHGGNPSHHETRTFNGAIDGPGSLTFSGVNNNTFTFNASNSYAGGTWISGGRPRIRAHVDGALGAGDVHINEQALLIIAGGLSNVIADDAMLFLEGIGNNSQPAKVQLDSSETVKWFWDDGVLMPTGTWGRIGSGAMFETNRFTGNGILTVTGGQDLRPPLPDPITFAVVPHGVSVDTISMTATLGVDISPPVEYQFTNLTTGTLGPWQGNPTMLDAGLL
ncbi:MAG: hypothetical protein AAF492_26500, partial [Verrucomicrobiota bacterium]